MFTFKSLFLFKSLLLLLYISFLFSCGDLGVGECTPFCLRGPTDSPQTPPICPANCLSRPFCGCFSNSAVCRLCDDAQVDDLTVFIDVSEIELSDGFGSPCPKSDVELRLDFLLFENPVGESPWQASGSSKT